MSVRSTLTTALVFVAAPLALAAETPAAPGPAPAPRDNDAEIVKKLNNPVSKLISIPLQNNIDFGAGPDGDGFQYELDAKFIFPVELTQNLKLINRIVLPFIHQEDTLIKGASQTGLGDTSASFFFAPEERQPGELVWGVGPIILLPTATDDLLGSEKWSAGPTVLLLKQNSNGFTAGLLASHAWSFAGDRDRDSVSRTTIQPFGHYSTSAHTTFSIESETTYDWTSGQWVVPVNLMVSQLVRIGKLPVSFQLGWRYYIEKPDTGPNWGLRFSVTFVILR